MRSAKRRVSCSVRVVSERRASAPGASPRAGSTRRRRHVPARCRYSGSLHPPKCTGAVLVRSLHWRLVSIEGEDDEREPQSLSLEACFAHGANEPVGDPRDPEADRAAGDHLARRRPARGRDVPGRGDARGDHARAARYAARGAAVRSERRLRAAARMGRGRGRAPRPGGRRSAGADHERLAARPRSRRQGADRCRQPGRCRVADLPRRVAGVRSLRARVRDGRVRRRRAAARCLRRERQGRALPLCVAQLSESERPLDRRRPPRRARPRRRGDRRADRRGQPTASSGSMLRRPRPSPAIGATARSTSAASRRCLRRGCASAT